MSGPYDPQQDPNQQGGYQQGGYQQGGYQQGGYLQGGYQQPALGGYQQGGYPQGPQGGYPGGYPTPPRRNGLILGIAAIVAIAVAAAVVLIIVLNKDDTTQAGGPNDTGNTGQQSAPVPPTDDPPTTQPKTNDQTSDDNTDDQTSEQNTDDQNTDDQNTDSGDDSGAAESDIRARTDKFFQAIESRDWDTTASLICEDDREAFTKELQTEFADEGTSISYKIDSVTVDGSSATMHVTITIGDQSDGTTLRLTKDSGEWLLCGL